MSKITGPVSPEHLLEMLYHRELGYSLYDGQDTGWGFQTAFRALKLEVSEEQIKAYRDHFIEHGYAKFSGEDDPECRITSVGEEAARTSIMRRKPVYSLQRIKSYDWGFWGAIAAILAAIFSLASFLKVQS